MFSSLKHVGIDDGLDRDKVLAADATLVGVSTDVASVSTDVASVSIAEISGLKGMVHRRILLVMWNAVMHTAWN